MSRTPPYQRTSWQQRTLGHLKLARISNSPTIVTNTLAGVALAGSGWHAHTSLLIALAMLLCYTGGMYLNDLWDYAIDCRIRPERPLPSNTVTVLEASLTCATLFTVSIILLAQVGSWPLLSGGILIGLIVVYDRWHKGNPWSPALMGACRALVYSTALLAVLPKGIAHVLLPAALLAGYVAALTWFAKLAATARQRQTQTTRTWHYFLLTLLYLPAVWALINPGAASGYLWLRLLVAATFVLWVWWSVHLAKEGQIDRAVGQFIAGISLVDALILVAQGWWPATIVALAAWGLTLSLQRYVKGT